MNLLFISILTVASLSLLPTKTLGTTEVQEPPQALPLAAQIQPTTGGGGGEIWQEDDREVLIRNERGTKNNGNGSGPGKRGKNKKIKNSNENSKVHNIQQQQPHQLQLPKSQHHHHQDQQPSLHQQQKQLKQQQSTIHNKHLHKQNNGKAENGQGSSSCRYVKSQWTECDPKTNTRSRTLTLKKGEDACVATRTIQKKCKKACRYEKGAWSECTTGQMSRTDKLKSTSDPTCQATRVVNKNCNQGKSKDKSNKERKNKDKGARKGRA